MNRKLSRKAGRIARTVAQRSVGRSASQMVTGATGAAGALVGRGLPFVLPRATRRVGAVGMMAIAVGGILLSRWRVHRDMRRAAAAEAGPDSQRRAEVILGGPTTPGRATPGR